MVCKEFSSSLHQCNTFFKRNLKKKLKTADIRLFLKGRARGWAQSTSSPILLLTGSQRPQQVSSKSVDPGKNPQGWGVGAVLSECSDPKNGRKGLKNGAAEGCPVWIPLELRLQGGGSKGFQ